MSTITVPPIVNDQGNINVHKDEGAKIPLTVEDEGGVELDASAIPLYFVSGVFRKALSADPNNPEGRLVVLTPADLVAIVHGANFRVVDESDVDLPVIRWEGRIYKRG
jgi:hypothetical protein